MTSYKEKGTGTKKPELQYSYPSLITFLPQSGAKVALSKRETVSAAHAASPKTRMTKDDTMNEIITIEMIATLILPFIVAAGFLHSRRQMMR